MSLQHHMCCFPYYGTVRPHELYRHRDVNIDRRTYVELDVCTGLSVELDVCTGFSVGLV